MRNGAVDWREVGVVDYPLTVKILFDVADPYVHSWFLKKTGCKAQRASEFRERNLGSRLWGIQNPSFEEKTRSPLNEILT